VSRRVEWTDRARKDLKKLDRRTRDRIIAAVEEFARTGRGDVRRLQSTKEEVYRLRVGDWRVFFTLEGQILMLVLRLRPRGGAY
jgi:mRNA interferase RelE/StbE